MASTITELEQAIESAVAEGFRNKLVARGQARSIIWEDGVLPEGAPEFSITLTYELLSYGYSLLSLGVRLSDLGGDRNIARQAYENAAAAIESVITKGPGDDVAYGFHQIVAASAYHLGRFSARAYSLLVQADWIQKNATPGEKALAFLMLRDFNHLFEIIEGWRINGPGTDLAIAELLATTFFNKNGDLKSGDWGDDHEGAFDAVDRTLTDNFLGAIAIFLLALERGDSGLVELSKVQLQGGLRSCAEFNILQQWWVHRLAINIIDDLWKCSFHQRLPILPSEVNKDEWSRLRDLYISLLYTKNKAEIELWPTQLNAADQATGSDESLVISLPTSAGKTRIAELCILRCISMGRRVVFVTPLRALSAQTEAALQQIFVPLNKSVSSLYGSIGTSGFDEDVLMKSDIIVATPEKLDFALRNDPELLNDVGLIVLDEGHMIGVDEREVRYEVQIQRLLKREDAGKRRIVCLSAILPSGEQLEDFVNWITQDQPQGLIQKNWRPTRLRYGEIAWNGSQAQMNIRVGEERPFVPGFLSARKPPPISKRTNLFPHDQRELCLASAWRLVQDGHTVLLFCPIRASVIPFAEAIVDLNERGLLNSVLDCDEAALDSAIAIGAEWLGDTHPALQCLKLGVAIHHGALPTPFRREIERLLRDRVLKITVSSPTLAQGLNLSATVLIVHSLWRNGEILKVAEFKNIVGRAGRAYIDVEGLVLHPMFDDHAKRQSDWQTLTDDESGREMRSGLFRLVASLLARMLRKLGTKNVDALFDFVLNNAELWSFPIVKREPARQTDIQAKRWKQHLTTLDTAILSMLGEQEVNDQDVEEALDTILASSLWERNLKRQSEKVRDIVTLTLRRRISHIWSNTNGAQRRAFFLAGVGLDSGLKLDQVAAEANKLLVEANGAVLNGDEDGAVESITKLAELLFEISPFNPDPLPKNWKIILALWLRGKPIKSEMDQHSDDTLQFIESGLVYRLPWGMEAIRVRSLANGDKIYNDMTFEDLELRFAVTAVETGTLNRHAAILMQAGFSSRLAAIKAVQDTDAQFTNLHELRIWLRSDAVSNLSDDAKWPTPETSKLWHAFRTAFAPHKRIRWEKRARDVSATWNKGKAPMEFGQSLHVRDLSGEDATSLLSADFEVLGVLSERLNPDRSGLTRVTTKFDSSSVRLEYFGPDDLYL